MRRIHPAPPESPWFARVGQGWHFSVRPHSPAGWAITALYVMAMIGISLFLLGRDEPGTARLIAWSVIMSAMTLALLITAWRTSARIGPAGNSLRTRMRSNRDGSYHPERPADRRVRSRGHGSGRDSGESGTRHAE